MRATYPDQRVLIVAHGAAIHALLTSLADEHMGIKDTRLENACLNYVEWTDGEWKVNDYNVVSHLTQSALLKEPVFIAGSFHVKNNDKIIFFISKFEIDDSLFYLFYGISVIECLSSNGS